MAKFEITAPNGQVLEIEGDTPPSEAELDEIFAQTKTNSKSNAPKRPTAKGIDITPSGLFKGSQNVVASALASPGIAKRDNISIPEAYKQNMETIEQYRQNNPTPIQDFAVDTAGYLMLPELKGAGLGARALTGLGQGALIGGLEGLKNEASLGSITKGAGLGGALGAGLNSALSPIAKGVGNLANKMYLNAFPGLKEDVVRRLINPNSKALDLDEVGAQQLLTNTTERVRDAYNQMLADKGNVVGKLLNDLPESKKFSANDILQDYDKIYNNYSLSKNEALNPAKNATQKEYAKIEDMLYGPDIDRNGIFKDEIEKLKFPHGTLEVQRGKKQGGKFWSHTLQNLENDITNANRRFNSDVIGNLKDNPSWAQDVDKITAMENYIDNLHVPEDYKAQLYNRFYQAIGKSDILDKGNNAISPKELYDINKNISNMVDWNKADSAMKNDVLEKMYGANAERISNLSPELKEANAEYSKLMDFKKNEGIRPILNNGEKIDQAASALRNYEGNISQGNRNRNINDLEKMLVEGKYTKPFLNDIDDVNAANELLKTVQTGFNPFGLTDTLKNVVETPILKASRGINRMMENMPDKYKALGQKIPESVRRLLTVGALEQLPLQGGISYEEY